VKRIPAIIALFLAVPLIAVAQTKFVPTLAPTTHCICLADGNHHCSIIGLSPGTKLTCETVGGTWVDPAPQTATKVCITDKGFYPPEVAEKECLAKGEHGRMGEIHATAMLSIPKTNTGASEIDSQTGRVVKLSDEEYARLQKLRQAVADEEMKIAAAHGVLLVPKLIHAGTNTCLATSYLTGLPSCDTDQYQAADRWQFRGQFLLVNVPKAVQTEAK
jgi:hypothetical protein